MLLRRIYGQLCYSPGARPPVIRPETALLCVDELSRRFQEEKDGFDLDLGDGETYRLDRLMCSIEADAPATKAIIQCANYRYHEHSRMPSGTWLAEEVLRRLREDCRKHLPGDTMRF